MFHFSLGSRIRAAPPGVSPETAEFVARTNGGYPDFPSGIPTSLDLHGNLANPTAVRDFEVTSSARDALSSHHDRGFGNLNLFLSAFFR